jgi:hypothetical protein
MAGPEYEDDSSVDGELWRRIPPWHFVYDARLDRVRPSSSAFDNDPDGHPMSIVIADVAAEAGRSPETALAGFEKFALAEFASEVARGIGQKLVRQPTVEEPAHGLVVGATPRSVRKRLAGSSHWVVAPPESPSRA